MRRFHAVILDFGNTLVSSGSLAASFPQVLSDPRAESIGNEIEARISALYVPEQTDQPDWREIWRGAFERFGLPWSEELAIKHLRRFLEATPVYPYTVPLLNSLRRAGLRLALLSNATGPKCVFDEYLDRRGLTNYFEQVIWSCDIGYRKPSPHAFRTALERMALPVHDALMVGDSEVADIRGAQSVGMATAQIVDGPACGTSTADFVVERNRIVDELPRIATGSQSAAAGQVCATSEPE